MLSITVPLEISFDNSEKQEFVVTKSFDLELEHSLFSLSKWESFFEKRFLNHDVEKTPDEMLWYIKAMTLTKDVPEDVYLHLSSQNFDAIQAYMKAPMTATWFNDTMNKGGPSEVLTAEIIYYWMVTQQIPFECQYWHINRLITLVRVISSKNTPAKKMSKAEIAQQNRELNAQRRAQMGTTG